MAHPILFADEHALMVSYWDNDQPPFHPAKAPITVVRFHKPRWHQLGPSTENGSGAELRKVYQVRDSPLLRQFQNVTHYIIAFHDSTLECVAHSFTASFEQIGWNEQYPLMVEALSGQGDAA